MSVTVSAAFKAAPSNTTNGPATGGTDIQQTRESLFERFEKEHTDVGNGSSGLPAADGWHIIGSAKVYVGDTEPTTRPDGSTALDSDDEGRCWLDTSTTTPGLKYWDGTAWAPMLRPYFYGNITRSGTTWSYANTVERGFSYDDATKYITILQDGWYRITLTARWNDGDTVAIGITQYRGAVKIQDDARVLYMASSSAVRNHTTCWDFEAEAGDTFIMTDANGRLINYTTVPNFLSVTRVDA